ncbi:MAG: hypothetical protein O7J95_03910 [Planctomycetota bacterium]|nr:hypothetical protein [Planctomycetota bacterium]
MSPTPFSAPGLRRRRSLLALAILAGVSCRPEGAPPEAGEARRDPAAKAPLQPTDERSGDGSGRVMELRMEM